MVGACRQVIEYYSTVQTAVQKTGAFFKYIFLFANNIINATMRRFAHEFCIVLKIFWCNCVQNVFKNEKGLFLALSLLNLQRFIILQLHLVAKSTSLERLRLSIFKFCYFLEVFVF